MHIGTCVQLHVYPFSCTKFELAISVKCFAPPAFAVSDDTQL